MYFTNMQVTWKIRPLLKSLSFIFTNGQVTHYNETNVEKLLCFFFMNGQVTWKNETNLQNSSYFSLGQVAHENQTNLKNLCIFHQQVGHLENKINVEITFMYFTNGQVVWNNQTTFVKSLNLTLTTRLPGTSRPFLKDL